MASFFFGVGEVKAFLKTGKITSNTVQILGKIPANVSKLLTALSGKLKKLQNNVLAYVLSANTYIEIARFTDEGVIIAEKWIDEPVQIIETIGEVTYKKADDVAEITEEIGIVKNASGEYGLSNALSLIRQLLARPTYKSFRTIYSNQNKTTTLIGKWSELLNGNQNGLQKVFNELSDTDLNIYMQSGKFDNKGGFNMLSIEGWSTTVVQEAVEQGITVGTKAFDDFIWNRYNKPWLESAMQRGDEIILWSSPNHLSRKRYSDGIFGDSFYQRELNFLKDNSSYYGYNYTESIQLGMFSK